MFGLCVVETPDTTRGIVTIKKELTMRYNPHCKNISLKANCLVSVSFRGFMWLKLFTDLGKHHVFQGVG